ncbi:MAG: hypothetical protein C4K49_03780 [Candidatus Thorarchaeota archaeon]|nr:MAG: hypothetical protein C4K49_03780 [Candidatus Thorarchaeota archaeon]
MTGISAASKTAIILCIVIGSSFVSVVWLGSVIGGNSQIPFEDVDRGWSCGRSIRENLLITDAQTWQDLWTSMKSGESDPPSLPYVNFTTELLIAVFLGEFGSSGYFANITGVFLLLTGYRIFVVEVHPDPNCGVLAVMTQPYHIISIPRAQQDFSATFVYSVHVRSCMP